MTAVLLDTHAWVWSLTDPGLLSLTARSAIDTADAVHVSPISFFEIGHKVRLGKWPEMEPHITGLPEILRQQGGLQAALTAEICLRAGVAEWPHRDPFDRLLAATAEMTGFPLVTRDAAFDALASVRCIW